MTYSLFAIIRIKSHIDIRIFENHKVSIYSHKFLNQNYRVNNMILKIFLCLVALNFILVMSSEASQNQKIVD